MKALHHCTRAAYLYSQEVFTVYDSVLYKGNNLTLYLFVKILLCEHHNVQVKRLIIHEGYSFFVQLTSF